MIIKSRFNDSLDHQRSQNLSDYVNTKPLSRCEVPKPTLPLAQLTWAIAPREDRASAWRKLEAILAQVTAQDPLLRVTGGERPLRLSGLGDAHLARALRRISAESGLELNHGLPA